MKGLYVLLALVVTASGFRLSDIIREEWKAFKLEHKKQYSSIKQELRHLMTYLSNRKMVAKHNKRFEMGLESTRLKTNHFSDIPRSRILSNMNGFDPKLERPENPREAIFVVPHNVTLPSTKDWRILGAVTAVKNQMECRSCWAFSATGALEGQLFRKNGKLLSLSEQNLVDCSDLNNGCYGGTMNDAFEYITDNGGIDLETSYPYEGMENWCRYNPKNSGGTDLSYKTIPEGDEMKLKVAVASKGPISVAVDARLQSFIHHSDGVYYNKDCTNNSNHAMLVVGYGKDPEGGDYWLVKNSWGNKWGEQGYIKMARNRHNHCGIASYASFPVV